MSLKKIAEVKRKRRFSTGDGVYEGDGYAGSDMGMGYQGGNYGGTGMNGSNTDAQDAANLAAFDNSQLSTFDGNYGPTYSGGVQTGGGDAGYTGSGANIDTDLALAAFDRSQPNSGLQNLASGPLGKMGTVGGVVTGLAALDRAMAARNSGDNYGIDAQGNKVGNWGEGTTTAGYNNEDIRGDRPDTQPFGAGTPAQTTPAAGAPAVANTGMRQYMWDPVVRQYRLANLGAQDNPMGYSQGQVFQMAAGGRAPSGISAGMPRFVQGGGTGLSDSVPVQMDDGGEGRLADGEFVIPADVVSGLGGGSSAAGSKMLFDMMERIREQAHGKTQQIRPVDPQQVLPA